MIDNLYKPASVHWIELNRYRHWRMCFERIFPAFARWQPGILYLTQMPSPSLNTVELIVIHNGRESQPSLRTQFKFATVYSIHTQSLSWCSTGLVPNVLPRVVHGSDGPAGRVGSGRVTILPDFGGSGRVGSGQHFGFISFLLIISWYLNRYESSYTTGRGSGRVRLFVSSCGSVGSGQRFAGSGRVQEKWPVDNSGTTPKGWRLGYMVSYDHMYIYYSD